jgi:hypothetical protein
MMSEHDEQTPGMQWSYRITQAMFSVAAIFCFVVFWYAGGVLAIPAERAHGGSLLGQPTVGSVLVALITAVVLLAGCTLFVHAFLRSRWEMASLAAATAGFSAWSMRGGPIHYTLFHAPTAAIFIRLACELILLGAIVGVIWLLMWQDPAGEQPASPAGVAGSVLKHTLIMALLVFLLAQTDQKKQCVAGVFLAALISASIVHANWPQRGAGKWFWVAPIIVGVLGYLVAFFQADNWSSGMHELTGLWAPLARPLPLDYASVGMFGSLLGYWMNIPEENREEAENSQSVGSSPAGEGSL